ncbi:hypothetical protein KY312_01460 [Candidatus Woesearchaeota archaeon]|nr:hypothetical protein [Candidatus Woesearchaeota archaeon]
MKVRGYRRLTWALYENFGERKVAGVISFIFDAHYHVFYPVPRDVEHISFVSENLLGISVDELRMQPELAERLIPVNIAIQENTVVEYLIGVSGLELGLRVRHREKDLRSAEKYTLEFIKKGEIWHMEEIKGKIEYRYKK